MKLLSNRIKRSLGYMATSLLSSMLLVSYGFADSPVLTIPYKVVNVGQDYIGQSINEIADLGAYLGGGADKVTLAITNSTNTTLWMMQTSLKGSSNAIVGLPAGESTSLPSQDWQGPDPKNVWMMVLNCGTDTPTIPTDPGTVPTGCTQICNSDATAPGIWKDNDSINKVPYGGTINTLLFAGDASSTGTQCTWTAGKAPALPEPNIYAYGTKTGATDHFSHFLDLNTKALQVQLNADFSEQDYQQLQQEMTTSKANNCTHYNGDSNLTLCKYDLHIPKGKYNNEHDAVLQVLINNGIRAKTAVDLANAHIKGQPNYYEVAVGTGDIPNSENTIVNLKQYFVDPSQSSVSSKKTSIKYS